MFFIFILSVFFFFIGCAGQPTGKLLVSEPYEEREQARRLAELQETFSLLVKAKALCMEMQDWLRFVKSETLVKRLEELSNNTDPIGYTVKGVWEYLSECEEAFTAFKMLPPKEFTNKKDMEWIFRYFENAPWTSTLTSKKKDTILALLNTKEYPVSLRGFSKKRAGLALKRVVFQLGRYSPEDERETWDRLRIETIAESIMLCDNAEPSAEQLERITQLVQKVFSMM